MSVGGVPGSHITPTGGPGQAHAAARINNRAVRPGAQAHAHAARHAHTRATFKMTKATSLKNRKTKSKKAGGARKREGVSGGKKPAGLGPVQAVKKSMERPKKRQEFKKHFASKHALLNGENFTTAVEDIVGSMTTSGAARMTPTKLRNILIKRFAIPPNADPADRNLALWQAVEGISQFSESIGLNETLGPEKHDELMKAGSLLLKQLKKETQEAAGAALEDIEEIDAAALEEMVKEDRAVFEANVFSAASADSNYAGIHEMAKTVFSIEKDEDAGVYVIKTIRHGTLEMNPLTNETGGQLLNKTKMGAVIQTIRNVRSVWQVVQHFQTELATMRTNMTRSMMGQ